MVEPSKELEAPSVETAKRQALEALSQKQRRVEQRLEPLEPYLTQKEQEQKERLKQDLQKMEPKPSVQEKVEQKAADLSHLAAPEQLEQLVELAFEQGASTAVAAAKKLKSDFVLDALHDMLAKDQLYKKLKQAGKL